MGSHGANQDQLLTLYQALGYALSGFLDPSLSPLQHDLVNIQIIFSTIRLRLT